MQEAERKDSARRHLDVLEAWLHRFISYYLTRTYGRNFFRAQFPDGTSIVKAAVREQVDRRRAAEPERFGSDVEALTLGDAITPILHPRLYPDQFKAGFIRAFPDGVVEARTFLSRLETHRNLLAHGAV